MDIVMCMIVTLDIIINIMMSRAVLVGNEQEHVINIVVIQMTRG